jgi:hypothetical protein
MNNNIKTLLDRSDSVIIPFVFYLVLICFILITIGNCIAIYCLLWTVIYDENQLSKTDFIVSVLPTIATGFTFVSSTIDRILRQDTVSRQS